MLGVTHSARNAASLPSQRSSAGRKSSASSLKSTPYVRPVLQKTKAVDHDVATSSSAASAPDVESIAVEATRLPDTINDAPEVSTNPNPSIDASPAADAESVAVPEVVVTTATPLKKKKKKKTQQRELTVQTAPSPPPVTVAKQDTFPFAQALVGVGLLTAAGVFLMKKQGAEGGKSSSQPISAAAAVNLAKSFKAGIDGLGQQKSLQRESQQYLNELSDQLRSLSAVDLSAKNLGDEGAAYVIEGLAFNTTCLAADLSKNGIGKVGAAAVCEVLPSSAVQTMSLSTNSLGDEGAEQLAKMLAVNRNLTALDLSSNGIGDTGAQALAEALKLNSALTRLDLSSNTIDIPGAGALAEAMAENASLQSLGLNDNYLGAEGVGSLAAALRKNVFLMELFIKGNEAGDEGIVKLCEALKARDCKITALDLSNNSIGLKGAEALAELLTEKPFIKELNLHMNDIGDAGIEKLSKALKLNQELRSLDLGGNGIGPQGMEALAFALRGHEALATLELGYNPIGPKGAAALGAVSKYDLKSLESLKLGWCKIGEFEGAKAMGELLMFNSTLQLLDLRGNNLGNNGAFHMAAAMKQHENPNLRELDLGYNEIKDDGACALAQSMKANPDGAVQELKLNNNYITRLGQVALSEAVDMVYEMARGRSSTIHF